MGKLSYASLVDASKPADKHEEFVQEEQPVKQAADKPVVANKSTAPSVSKKQNRDVGINVPLYQSTNVPTQPDTLIAAIHKSLRERSSEAASYRLSKMEKQRLTVALHELKMQTLLDPDALDISSNENEVARIALNYLLNDYQAAKEDSILVRVLTSLRT